MRDTHADAREAQLAAIRRMRPVERLRQAFELSEAMRELALVGLRTRHPGLSEADLIERLVGRSPAPS